MAAGRHAGRLLDEEGEMREQGAKTMKNGTKLHGVVLFASALLLGICFGFASTAAALDVQLQPTDCVKCHQGKMSVVRGIGRR